MADTIHVGMLGCGIVGSAVARILEEHAEEITESAGARIQLERVAVRSLSKERNVPLASEIFTNDPREIVADSNIQVLVEVMGGIEPARTLTIDAMRAGKHVVSANKELIATLGKDLFDEAESSRVDFYFEASVAGGIPIIRPLKESLAGERVLRVMGIVNGTTNYVLTKMSEEGLELDQALAEAERLGYAELDPTADIEGFDAAAKLAILASIAFNSRVVAGDVYREGIAGISLRDIEFARTLGYAVKLLAIGELIDGEISVRVHPAMIPENHPLASVRENLNAVFVEGENVGELMFYGRGAGGPPTATSVVGDLVQVARNIQSGGRGPGCTCHKQGIPIRPMDLTQSQYYILLEVLDRPGVLAKIAQSFADHNVNIKSVWQEGFGDEARLVMVTHTALEKDFQALLAVLRRLDVVEEIASALRVQSADD
ncbi:MAG TPA: homoserine dehydrogenase [Actinomycetota bacterium]|nr:homoserine dehydrogenase [Actinomycetota bacterium]